MISTSTHRLKGQKEHPNFLSWHAIRLKHMRENIATYTLWYHVWHLAPLSTLRSSSSLLNLHGGYLESTVFFLHFSQVVNHMSFQDHLHIVQTLLGWRSRWKKICYCILLLYRFRLFSRKWQILHKVSILSRYTKAIVEHSQFSLWSQTLHICTQILKLQLKRNVETQQEISLASLRSLTDSHASLGWRTNKWNTV